MSCEERQILEEVKAVRSGLRSVACLSPEAMVISGLKPLPGAMSASVALLQPWSVYISVAPDATED